MKMGKKVVQFPAPRVVDTAAQRNLAAIVGRAKKLLPVAFEGASHITWEDPVWELGDTFFTAGANRLRRAYWSLDDCGSSLREELQTSYADMAKALFVLRHVERVRTAVYALIRALQFLYGAARSRCDEIVVHNLQAVDFDVAARRLRETGGSSRAAGYGTCLGQIASFLNEHELLAARFKWKNPNKYPPSPYRIGDEYDEARRKKLPDGETLLAVTEAFRRAKEPADVLVSSCLAILSCAPSRLHELFQLPLDCEVEQRNAGGHVYGLRWFPGKGAKPMIKWVPAPMVEVCKMAIHRIRELTKPARQVAKWYEQHPDRLFVPAELKMLSREPDAWVRASRLALLTNVIPRHFTKWLKEKQIATKPIPSVRVVGKRAFAARFRDVEAKILEDLPRGFPVANKHGIRYSELLLVARKCDFLQDRTHPGMIAPISICSLFVSLTPTDGNGRKMSIFQRLGIVRKDGSDVKLSSHQLRHWLNTIVNRGALSELEIAMWSGRTSVQQNSVYDHTPSESVLAEFGKVDRDFRNFVVRMPVTKQDFDALARKPAVHATEFGFCLHDYAQSPCERHRDCHNCGEHCVVKGLREREERIRRTLEITRSALREAEAEILAGTRGADRWVAHHRITVQRLENLVAIISDREVPDGSLITPKPDPRLTSPLQRALESSGRRLEKSEQ